MISVIRDVISGEVDFIYLIVYLGSIAFVVFCTLPLHEFAHAFAADKLGDDTPRRMGRLTVSPLAHISPLGALMIFLCGFGYAKAVPVRMKNFKNPKRDMALVALAGPLCNILQAFVYMFLYSFITSRPWGNQAIIFIALFLSIRVICSLKKVWQRKILYMHFYLLLSTYYLQNPCKA